jgi:hypothetical protein
MPSGTTDVTAVKFGYYDKTKTQILTDSTESILDFAMKALSVSEVKGVVVANDSLKPVEGVKVTLMGYNQTYTILTAADGKFLFNNIYGDKDYVITYEHPKYYPLTDSISVPVNGLDLATVILDEIEQNAFNVIASWNNNMVDINWQAPYSGSEALVDPTMGTEHPYYWYNEPDEDVMLGNLFKVSKPGTVTSIEFQPMVVEGAVSGELYLRFYDKNRTEFMKPVSFMIPDTSTEWLNIPVPNFSYNDEFYVMVHWNKVHEQTAALNQHILGEDVAWVVDKTHGWILLSDLVGGQYKGAFSIRANV